MDTLYKKLFDYAAWGIFYVAAILVLVVTFTAPEPPWHFVLSTLWILFFWNATTICKWLWSQMVVRWQAKLVALLLISGAFFVLWYVDRPKPPVDFAEKFRQREQAQQLQEERRGQSEKAAQAEQAR